jgi:hypothetical protein
MRTKEFFSEIAFLLVQLYWKELIMITKKITLLKNDLIMAVNFNILAKIGNTQSYSAK